VNVGITGARGFVGSLLAAAFASAGHRVVPFVRASSAPLPYGARAFDLDAPVDAATLAGLDALVHAAYIPATPANPDAARRNVEGTLRLHAAARSAGVPFVFLSSLSARADAQSAYGKHKFALEATLAPAGAVIVRPGLVTGDGGLLRNLAAALQRPFVPLVDRGRQTVQVVSGSALAAAIEIALAAGLHGRLTVCSEESVTLSHIAHSMAALLNVRPRFVNVPWGIAFAVATLAERAGATLPLTTENLLGMRVSQAATPSPELLARGWRPESWDAIVPALVFGS
jgi:nucleoside-diphosphate-sugar epimerase